MGLRPGELLHLISSEAALWSEESNVHIVVCLPGQRGRISAEPTSDPHLLSSVVVALISIQISCTRGRALLEGLVLWTG